MVSVLADADADVDGPRIYVCIYVCKGSTGVQMCQESAGLGVRIEYRVRNCKVECATLYCALEVIVITRSGKHVREITIIERWLRYLAYIDYAKSTRAKRGCRLPTALLCSALLAGG